MQLSDVNNIFLFNQQSLVQEIVDVSDYRIGIFSLKNKHSNDNEDCLFLSHTKGKIRFGVADGAGGHPRGKDAAYEVADELRVIDDGAILKRIESANRRVLDLKAGARSTVAFGQIDESDICFHTVGDSEILYWNATGRELYTSIPHSPAGLKVEAGLTSQEESLTDPDRHIVNSLLGDDFIQIISTSSFELKKGHTILVGSDGLFDNISHIQLGDLVSTGNFEKSFEDIANICKEQNPENWLKDDDLTFILVRKIQS